MIYIRKQSVLTTLFPRQQWEPRNVANWCKTEIVEVSARLDNVKTCLISHKIIKNSQVSQKVGSFSTVKLERFILGTSNFLVLQRMFLASIFTLTTCLTNKQIKRYEFFVDQKQKMNFFKKIREKLIIVFFNVFMFLSYLTLNSKVRCFLINRFLTGQLKRRSWMDGG